MTAKEGGLSGADSEMFKELEIQVRYSVLHLEYIVVMVEVE